MSQRLQIDSNDGVALPEARLMSVLSLTACVLCVPPLAAHLKAGNLAATILVLGVATVNLQNFVNSLIWPSNDIARWWNGKILCDIEIKIYLGFGLAIVGATTCIFRQLAIIMDTDQGLTMVGDPQRRKRLAFEIFFCIVIPTHSMVVHYVVQSQRYWIVGIIGCTPSFDRSWPSYVLIFIWPILVSIIGTCYCSLAVFRLVKYRRQTSSVLASRSSITRSRFTRLFILAMGLLLAYFPLAIYTFLRNLGYPLHAYSWKTVHGPDWSDRIQSEPSNGAVGNFDRWIQVVTGYALFFFFGLGHEAVMMYKTWLTKFGLGPALQWWNKVFRRTSTASSGRYPLVRRSYQDPATPVDRVTIV